MRMNKDGLFKIMQITDMQEIPKVSPDTMALHQRIWSVV